MTGAALRRSALLALVLAVASAVAAAPARGSMIIGRNATDVQFAVNGGTALVTFRERGQVRRVLAVGAVDDDVKFKLDYAGGWGLYRRQVWKTFKNDCRLYDGPVLAWLVAACKASDGSYWALQRWQRMLPNQGYVPWKPEQAVWELHLSHWRGEPAKLEIYLDWAFRGKYHHLFGRYSYRGKGIHGFKSTNTGVPLDPYGRNIYLDTFGSVFAAAAWRRENSFLAHRPRGNFCYGFYGRPSYYFPGTRPPGHGKRYRATAIGPGVSPDVYWQGEGLGAYDPEYETRMNEIGDAIAGDDRLCRQH